ncbi:MAG: hypothetical protein M0T82_06995, partial [Desulfobacteraceae bacterium]|nr:hypothetical protein [Desulfobacteraceae bacterium]
MFVQDKPKNIQPAQNNQKIYVRIKKNSTRFKSVAEAERHLNFIRVQHDNQTFDRRDWLKGAPLSFKTLREGFIKSKEKSQISPKQIRYIDYVLEKAGKSWDRLSIKEIRERQIEDFFDMAHGVSNKTLANWKSVLKDFWTWVVRREKRESGLEMPEFPCIKFRLAMKKIVSVKD